MFIRTITEGPYRTNSYIIADSKGKGAIIDPTFDSAKIIMALVKEHKIEITAIYLTHSHLDHIADVPVLKKYYHCPLFVHEKDALNVKKPGSDGIRLPFPMEGTDPDFDFQEGLLYHLGDLIFSIIHTPGHSPGGVCLYFEKEKVLFSGDTLFKGTVGRMDLEGSSEEAMLKSLKRLEALPGDVKVYPGHGPSTILKEEQRWLPRAKELFGS